MLLARFLVSCSKVLSDVEEINHFLFASIVMFRPLPLNILHLFSHF